MSAQPKSTNITFHGANVTREERQQALGQRGCVVWLTGLSGSGKSTVARRVEQLLLAEGYMAYVLDGDNVRFGLNKDLGFSPEDRTENIRRIGEVAKLFADSCAITVTAFISPYQADRDEARSIMGEGEFVECLVDSPLEVCEERDPKGLYKKARSGEIPSFTGISAPYEAPAKADLIIQTSGCSVEESAAQVLDYLRTQGFIR